MSASPRPAATVVVLRPTDAAPQILLVRRTRQASFMADAYVFPGGRVEPDDGQGEAAFAAAAARELAEEAGVHVTAASLVPFARWITPSAEPRRYDTRFYVGSVPVGTEARVDATEVTELLWARAEQVLERHDQGGMLLPPPTLHTLASMRGLASIDQALAWARAQPIAAIQPRLVAGPEIVLPWDPRYAACDGEGEVVPGVGASAYLLRDGRFIAR